MRPAASSPRLRLPPATPFLRRAARRGPARSAGLFLFALFVLAPPPAAAGLLIDGLAVVVPKAGKKGKKGALRLLLHAPYPEGGPGTGPIASLTKKVGKSKGSWPLRFAFPADIDGDGFDEVVLVREGVKKGGRLKMRILRAPEKLGDKAKIVATVSKGLGRRRTRPPWSDSPR